MAFPVAPTWATDANFNSPGDSWNGDPTKVEPSAGKKAEGWEPSERPPAEFLNWFQNLSGTYLTALQDARYTQWDTADSSGLDDGAIEEIGYVAVGINDIGLKLWLGTTKHAAGTSAIALAKVTPNSSWVPVTTPIPSIPSLPATNRSIAFASDGDGAGGPRWLAAFSDAGGGSYLYSDNGTTWTLIGAPPHNIAHSVIRGNNSLWVTVGDVATGNAIWTSPEGAVWTNRGDPITGALRDVALGSVGGSPRLVACGDGGKLARSDNGTSWTLVPSIVATQLDAIVFDSVNSKFIVISNEGEVFNSTDGITWATGIDLTLSSGVFDKRLAVDSAGHVLFHSSATNRAWISINSGSTVRQVPANSKAVGAVGNIFYDAGYGFIMVGESLFTLSTTRGRVWVNRFNEVA